MVSITVGSHTLEISHPKKLYFPSSSITKTDIVKYYKKIGEVMIPHMRGRPVTMHRFPEGIEEEGFYQKETPDYFPPWIERISVKKKEGGSVTQVICNDAPTLVYLAEQGCITPHIWLSRIDNAKYPDKMIFDLDPPTNDFESVRTAAFYLKNIIERVGGTPFVMTTGSRGVHVTVPLHRKTPFDTVRTFAKKIAEILVHRYPEELTTAQRKEKRGNKLYVDTMRNAYAQTSVAPYAVRAKEGAPVATPVTWRELKKIPSSQEYTLDNIFRRLGQKEDPWRTMYTKKVNLSGAVDELRDST